MRTFESFPEQSVCPICNSNENKECTLVPISNTQKGYSCRAQPFHVDCLKNIRLEYIKDDRILWFRLD